MQQLSEQLEAVVFDLGNTLIEFGPQQVDRCDRALSAALESMFGPHSFDRLSTIQHEERRAPYSGEFREHDLGEITRSLVRRLFDAEADDDQINDLLEVRFQAMTAQVTVEPAVHDLLERLSERYRLGLISNYPCSRSINHCLTEHRLDRWFQSVVVSADIGHVKPHPLLFEQAARELNVRPEATLFVGDNWLGDIQGAKRFGMRAAFTTQFVPYEKFDREPGHHEPDLIITHLQELAGLVDFNEAGGA